MPTAEAILLSWVLEGKSARKMLHKLLLIILLIIGLAISVYLTGQKTGFFSLADISTAPQEVRISNITDNAFTISWMTAKAVDGYVSFGTTDQLGDTAIDDRDISGPKSHLTHYVTLKNLNPSTLYFYKINTGTIANQATVPVTENPPEVPEPIFGQVIKKDGSVPQEAIVYLRVQGGSLLSSYIREKGNWLITLNNARNNDLSSYITIKESDQVNISVSSEEGAAQVQVRLNDRNSIAKITLDAGQTSVIGNKKVQDYNHDGVINVFDYIYYIYNFYNLKQTI